MAALIEEAGGRQRTYAEARRQHETALAALDGLRLPNEARRAFELLADFVSVRAK